MNFNWKNIFKSWAGVPVLILVMLVLVWGIPYFTGKYKIWQFVNDYKKLNEPNYNDTYGGKTPEETYDLFIDALKVGDVELASKYFVVEKQNIWKKTLNTYRNSNLLEDFVTETEKNKQNWQKVKSETNDQASFTYLVTVKKDTQVNVTGNTVTLPAGEYTNTVMLQKYPSGIWKIQLL